MTPFVNRCFFALSLILLAGCATIPLQPERATARPPVQVSPSNPVPTWTPLTEPLVTLTPVPPVETRSPKTVSPSPIASASQPVEEPCAKDVMDGYLATLDPMVAAHLQEAKIAQTLEDLDEQQIEEYRDLAQQRLETLRELVPSACARSAHEQTSAAFEKLVQTWEAAGEKDVEGAKEILRSSYEDLAAAMALLAGY